MEMFYKIITRTGLMIILGFAGTYILWLIKGKKQSFGPLISKYGRLAAVLVLMFITLVLILLKDI
jgi:hypothetical protein